MSIGSFIIGALTGSFITYWGSEKVHDNVTDSLEKSKQLLENEQAINDLCYRQVQQWYHEGSLGTVVNILQQQQDARNAGLNFQANSKVYPNFQPSR